MKALEAALDGVVVAVVALGWSLRIGGWLMITVAALLLVIDVLFWLRMGLWDISRTGLALHGLGIPLETDWRGLQRVYDWISMVPAAASLFLLGAVLITIEETIRAG